MSVLLMSTRELIHFRRHVLHWLDVTERIRFRLCVHCPGVLVLAQLAPGYLVKLYRPVSSIVGHQQL